MKTLLSDIPNDDTPLIVMGDMNIHMEKKQTKTFLVLLSSFGLKLVHSPPTHQKGKNLDLVFTCDCSISDVTVTELPRSDHFLVLFSATFQQTQASEQVDSSRRNIETLTKTQLSEILKRLFEEETCKQIQQFTKLENKLKRLFERQKNMPRPLFRRTKEMQKYLRTEQKHKLKRLFGWHKKMLKFLYKRHKRAKMSI